MISASPRGQHQHSLCRGVPSVLTDPFVGFGAELIKAGSTDRALIRAGDQDVEFYVAASALTSDRFQRKDKKKEFTTSH